MKISYTWLKDFIDFALSPRDLCEVLLALGFETTIASSHGEWTNVVTARVVECGKHPQADKLSLCAVSDGTVTYPVVCGAPNVKAGQIIALARVGATLPNGMTIKKASIRGAESHGMICSETELGISADAAGIMVMPADTPVGVPLEKALSADTILNIEITSNRGDALSHWGVARELAAKFASPVRLPAVDGRLLSATFPAAVKNITPSLPSPGYDGSVLPGAFPVTISDPDLCQRYIGAVIEGVTIRPSPDWISRRLESCGIRPINIIVDITNYVLLELGHPLHAFDLSRLEGRSIIVRRAQAGESITALDGRNYTLTEAMLVIADEKTPQAIAGVMGGESSGVTDSTTDIVLESAVFSPTSIRKTARTLGISTDASYRFERGCSWDEAELASCRAINLILELAGGRLVDRTDAAPRPHVPSIVTLRTDRVASLLGSPVAYPDIKKILEGLSMSLRDMPDGCQVTVPSWRRDITIEADLIEEIARVRGYDRIDDTVLPIIPDMCAGREHSSSVDAACRDLAAAGFSEAMNYSFVEQSELDLFCLDSPHRIANPLSREYELLRPSLVPGLWKNLRLNLSQGLSSVRLFETGTIFTSTGERSSLALIMTGPVWGAWWRWYGKDVYQATDFHFLSGLISSLLEGRSYRIVPAKPALPFLHPGKTARIEIAGTNAGTFGIIRPDLSNALEIGEVAYAELDCTLLDAPVAGIKKRYEALNRFPAVHLDLSLVAPSTTPVQDIFKTISRSAGADISVVSHLMDIYNDPARLGQDRVSYTLRLALRHDSRTLSELDTRQITAAVLDALKSKLAVTLRQ